MTAHLSPFVTQGLLALVLAIAGTLVVLAIGLCRTAARPAPTPPPDAAAAPEVEPVPPRALSDALRPYRSEVYDQELEELEQMWRAS